MLGHRSRNKIEWQKSKSQKIKKWDDNFLGNNAASNIKKAKFLYQILYLKNCGNYSLNSDPFEDS